MNGVFWFLIGAFVGLDVALAYAWLTIRRDARSLVRRVSSYTCTTDVRTSPDKEALIHDIQRRLVQDARRGVKRPW